MDNNKTKLILNKSPIRVIFIGALVITLYFNTQSYDSFNSAKFMALIVFSSWLTGYLINFKDQSKNIDLSYKENSLFKILILIFLASLFLSTLFAYNSTVALFGESFRRNGFLTYLGLNVFLYSSAKFVRMENLKYAIKIATLTLSIVVGYALIQIAGHDWVNWSSKQVFSTLGNTNFAGAVMAILVLLVIGQIFLNDIKILSKILIFVLFMLTIFSIYKTNARQALIQIIFGLFAIIVYFAWKKKKVFGILMLTLLFLFSVLGIFGALNQGPIRQIIYKDSVSVRGFYWRAGIQMLEKFPWFGVGLDNYNYFFKEFRDPEYPLRYGFSLTSSNAHNVFIQNYATGGVFVGTFYIFLQLFILRRAYILLKNFSGSSKFQVAMVVIAWFAYQLQSIVSIDNIGISIWGYILGGSIIGLSSNYTASETKPEYKIKGKKNLEISQILFSAGLIALSLTLVLPMFLLERNVWISKAVFTSQDENVKKEFNIANSKVLNSRLALPDYKNVVLTNMFDVSDKNQTIQKIQEVHKSDPRNLDTLNLLIYCEEKLLNYDLAIKYRLEVSRFDPWNAQNYLGLAQLYRVTNDKVNMRLAAEKILTFAENSPIAEIAKTEFLLNN